LKKYTAGYHQQAKKKTFSCARSSLDKNPHLALPLPPHPPPLTHTLPPLPLRSFPSIVGAICAVYILYSWFDHTIRKCAVVMFHICYLCLPFCYTRASQCKMCFMSENEFRVLQKCACYLQMLSNCLNLFKVLQKE